MKKNTKKKKTQKNWSGIIFLGVVVLLYLVLLCFDCEKAASSLKAGLNIFIKLIPVLVLVMAFMGLMNFLLKPKTASKYLGKSSGLRGWILAAAAGIISHGPIYAWYPLLKDLMKQGMRPGLAAVFLYNRAIKIPLLPIMIFYFGTKFVIILLVFTVTASFVEGNLIEIADKKIGLTLR